MKKEQQSSIAISPQEQRFEQITHEIQPNKLSTIEENANEGAVTATPTRKPSENEAQGNPEDNGEQAKLKCWGLSAFTRNAIIIGSVVLVLAIAGIVTTALVLSKRAQSSFFLNQTFSSTPISSSSSSIQTKVITAKDVETFKTENSLKVYTSQIRSSGSTNQVTGRATQEKENNFATYSLYDENTKTTITITSKEFQMKIAVDIPAVLQFALTNQPWPQSIPQDSQNPRNLQDSSQPSATQDTIYKNFTFYQVNEKIEQHLKKELVKKDKNVKVKQQVTHDLQYNNDIGSFEFVPSLRNAASTQSVSAALFDPANTPVINDFTNETEIALAVTTIVTGLMNKAQEFVEKRMNELQKVSGVQLVEVDKSHGQTTIYVNDPSDIQRLCANIKDSVLRCSRKLLNSEVINIASQDPTLTYDSNPTVVILIDA